ncbi:YncE family protein [Lacticaseibacillus pantheris]
MKKWLYWGMGIIVVLAVAVGIIVHVNTPKTYNDPHHQVLNDGTNISPTLTTQKNFYHQMTALYPHLKAPIDRDAPPETFVIPGLNQTQSLVVGQTNKVGISHQMDPQGLAITPQYLIISAYSRDKRYHSVLYLIDKKTGAYVKEIVLPRDSHVGGLAYDPVAKRLWVTTSTAAGKASLSGYDQKTLATANFARQHQATAFDHEVIIPGIKRTSFVTYHANALYIGYFRQNEQGAFVALPISKAGLPVPAAPKETKELRGDIHNGSYDTNKRLQGVTFYHGQLLFSQSFGPNPSHLLAFDNDGQRSWIDFDADDTQKSVSMPPYMEQVVADGDDLYVLFESASARYRKVDLDFHADRVVKFDLKRLLK